MYNQLNFRSLTSKVLNLTVITVELEWLLHAEL